MAIAYFDYGWGNDEDTGSSYTPDCNGSSAIVYTSFAPVVKPHKPMKKLPQAEAFDYPACLERINKIVEYRLEYEFQEIVYE